MNNIKSSFNMYDLENISGIKAHTIRIWEKRYELLEPKRLNRNVRLYDLDDLFKILNVALLYNRGIKISKIAKLSDEELLRTTKEFIDAKFKNDKAIVSLKLSMYNFDSVFFNQIYSEQIQFKSFSEVFQDLFIPFLEFIGLQWQTNTLIPAHEHFISNLIYQKIQLNIENLSWDNNTKSHETYVLYLPEEEMHEIGILYLNYELLLRGKRTIYLGRCIPLSDLVTLQEQHDNLIWLSQFTVAPSVDFLNGYMNEVEKLLLENNKFWAVSYRFGNQNYVTKNKNLKTFSSIKDVITKL